MASPFLGARLAGIIIGIGLLITGIQMIYAGIQGRRMQTPTTSHISR
jgi:purine-cytosine permease-like protein